VIGQRPGGVLGPTRQRQVIFPPLFDPSPLVFEAAFPKTNRAEQRDLGETRTVNAATLPGRIGETSETLRITAA
jgi:hypothetical protein